MNDEKRMIGNYAVEQSIHIGKKEIVFCVDKRAEHPYVVCYCDYNNPFSAPWPTEAVGTEDYLEATQIFCDRVQTQIEQTRAEQEKFKFDPTPFTVADCIPDMGNKEHLNERKKKRSKKSYSSKRREPTSRWAICVQIHG